MQTIEGKTKEERTDRSKQKSFSNRNVCTHLPIYSHEHLIAKQKAYENYKKIYPVKDKQNIYPFSKNPCIGYYVMKGYRYYPNSSKELQNANTAKHQKSSDKIITNMLKKYLHRKQHAEFKQQDALPKIQHSLSVHNPTNRSSIYSRPRKQPYTRVLTEFGEAGDKAYDDCL